MEGLSNESQQNEERTKTATVDREAGHGTGLGSQPRRPHMANSGGWACPPTSWVVHEDPEDAARPNKIAPGFHVYGDGSGWGPTPPRLGWGEDTLPGAPSGWGSRDTERGAVPPRADQDAARVDPGRGWGGDSAGRGWLRPFVEVQQRCLRGPGQLVQPRLRSIGHCSKLSCWWWS